VDGSDVDDCRTRVLGSLRCHRPAAVLRGRSPLNTGSAQMSVVKLLCAADLHMGRRPSRLPPTWSGGAVGPATAWAALVERARAERVDAVLLAGDVVDRF